MALQPCVYLIDSSIYVFRGWFTMPDDLIDRDGQPVNALYGFADFLLGLLERERPTHIACAFDSSRSDSCRTEIFPKYKANRDPAPPELQRQFGYCRTLVRAAGIAEFASTRFEADDIIGTLALNMRKHGFKNYIISGDKDLTQLLDDTDCWWEYSKDRRMQRADVHKRFGVYPEQIADMLALAGDAVDNIPGVPGIGPTIAARLLTKFSTLENLLMNIEKIGEMKFRGAPRIQALLQEHQELARLSKQLTVIMHDASLPTGHEELTRRSCDKQELNDLFEFIGFGQLRRQRWHTVLGT
jgi:DNA polymerase-1